MPVSFLDNDCLARFILLPKDTISFIENASNLISIDSKNFHFSSDSGKKESVNCLRLFPDNPVNSCHAAGVLKASKNNERSIQRAKEKGKDPVIQTYSGYAHTSYLEIINTSDDFIQFSVQHLEEEGNVAHCNIQLIEKDALQGRSQREIKKFKNTAIEKLQSKFRDYEQYAA